MLPRSLVVLALLCAAPAVHAASTPTGAGSPSCLRGNWVASQAETNRVMRALVPNLPAEVEGRLYMIFRDGAFQYGSRRLVYTASFGDVTLIARGRFFTLAPYTARRGVLTTGAGEVTTEWGKLTGIKDGKRIWRHGDIGDFTGRQVIDAISKGGLWLNLRMASEIDTRYHDLLAQMFEEVQARVPGFAAPKFDAGILISAPEAKVHYHADLPGQGLIQSRLGWLRFVRDRVLQPRHRIDGLLELTRLDLDGHLDLVPLEGCDGGSHAEGESIGGPITT